MARKIIVLTNGLGTASDPSFSAALWLSNPSSLRHAWQSASTGTNVPASAQVSWGYTAAELAALQSGCVVEKIYSGQAQNGATLAQAQAMVVNAYNQAQIELNATAPATDFAGRHWDGTSWWAGS